MVGLFLLLSSYPIALKAQSIRLNVDGIYAIPGGTFVKGSYESLKEFAYASKGKGIRLGVTFMDDDYPSDELTTGFLINLHWVNHSINEQKVKDELLTSSPDTSVVTIKYTPWNLYYLSVGGMLNWNWEYLELEVPLALLLGYAQGPIMSYRESNFLRYEITKNEGGLVGLATGIGIGVPLFDNKIVLRGGVDLQAGAIVLTQNFQDYSNGITSSGDDTPLLFTNMNLLLGIAYIIEY